MILIDEFSTGVDAKMKRDMWNTLKAVAVGKAIVITTRLYLPLTYRHILTDAQLYPQTPWKKPRRSQPKSASSRGACSVRPLISLPAARSLTHAHLHRPAVDSTEALLARHARYLVHFPGRTPADVARAQALVARIPGARMADDVATRFEVPVGGGMSLAQLFAVLSGGNFSEYTVERATLESVFLKVVRENNVLEEDRQGRRRRWQVC